MTVFDLLDAPLDGSNLIEAGAGTGKTYNIVGLFIRLIVEKELRARDILVVTYTIAATDELRDRIRKQLVETERALNRETSAGFFIGDFITRIRMAGRTEIARQLLRAAIRDFDEAQIFTIHGFSWRMLQEHAFESGAPFDTEVIPDEEALLREFTQDFWRRHFYEAPRELAGYALGKGLSPDYYLRILKEAGDNNLADLIPSAPPPEMDQITKEIGTFHACFHHLKERWRQERDAIAGLLHRPGLNGRIYGKHVDALLDILDALFLAETPPFPLSRDFEKITAGKLEQSVNKGHTPPHHPFFNLAEQLLAQARGLVDLFEQYLLFLRMETVRLARVDLPARKERRNILGYSDLLNNLFSALQTERGAVLIREVRLRFQAVLIDEFQDTDPIQYTIFKSLFMEKDLSEQRPFFVIGDPKQAIYAFRGADIFAYIEASRAMQRTWTLEKNWRSEPDLLKAVNTLFASATKPFLYDEIVYHPLVAAEKPARTTLQIDHSPEAPFQWWLIPEDAANAEEPSSGKSAPARGLAKSGLYARVAAAVASECARLIHLGREGRALIGSTPLAAGDLAILVRTNREADIMSKALAKRRLPHVLSSRESVFHATEAQDVLTILRGVVEPKNLPLVRAALVTNVMGMTGDDLQAMNAETNLFEDILRRFHEYQSLWESGGFMRMFRFFLESEHVPSRMLKFMEGERRLTNLLHIGELLHQATMAEHLTMHDLIAWLDNQIKTLDTQPEEYELRLERDEKAVKVVTIHKSKGLEYPVVFCPFAWGSSAPVKKRDYILFHDPARSFAPVVDFGSSTFEEHRRYAAGESLAEEIRLLYVALTRARHRTYFVWGRLQNAGASAAAYLFHQGSSVGDTDPAAAVLERYKTLTDTEFTREIAAIAGRAGGAIQLSSLPSSEDHADRTACITEELSCRLFTGHIDHSWKTASYTFLVSSKYGDRILDNDDQTPEREMTPAPEKMAPETESAASPGADLFGFPGGAQAGIFLHEIMEKIDYRQARSAETAAVIDEKLLQYGYGREWSPVIREMLAKVCTLNLRGEARSLTLSHIPCEDRRNEVEFYFPLRMISRDDLARMFRKGAVMADSALSTPPKLHCLERLFFHPLEGYLKGYIDLIFRFEGRYYLLDWKSNYLGNRPSDYGQSELLKAMDEGFYYIQYHLYALALHQYLSFRLPDYCYEDHFGGVYYLFLRGMDPEWGSANGVFFDRPPLALLNDMKDALIRPTSSSFPD